MPPSMSLSRLTRPTICSSCRHSMQRVQRASLSSSTRLHADEKTPPPPPSPSSSSSSSQTPNKPTDASKMFNDLSSALSSMQSLGIQQRSTTRSQSTDNLWSNISDAQSLVPRQQPGQEYRPVQQVRSAPHHLHIYAHKHNTHIVLTRPNREPILSYSAGNIGFRKAQRGSFDAAFQLAAYVMRTISDKGLLRNASFAESSASGIGTRKLEAPIREMEVVLRGFGKGREAVTKALLGTEGRFLRERITSVSDDTKLKFGGTRGMNPRRLG